METSSVLGRQRDKVYDIPLIATNEIPELAQKRVGCTVERRDVTVKSLIWVNLFLCLYQSLYIFSLVNMHWIVAYILSCL